MTFATTYTESTTFTVTHARHIAAKVATDLRRIQRLYGKPTDQQIADYEAELIAMLKGKYVRRVIYGFKRDGSYIEPTLRYEASDLNGSTSIDDDPGKIRPGANVAGASFASYMNYTQAWFDLTSAQQAAVEADLPFSRSNASEPSLSGHLSTDLNYSAGGRNLQRSTLRSW
ncbi:hypothetical protein D3C72_1010830 [compost metagenome]